MSRHPLLSTLSLLIFLSLALASCYEHAPIQTLKRPTATARDSCKGLTVNDGDTFTCDTNHNGRVDKPIERIRLLGIEATEMHYSRKNKSGKNQPYAQEAKDFLSSKVKGKTVWLAYDQEKSDQYGRTLAYVYETDSGQNSINEQLLAQGYATLFFLGRNRQLEKPFIQTALTARQKKVGLYQ